MSASCVSPELDTGPLGPGRAKRPAGRNGTGHTCLVPADAASSPVDLRLDLEDRKYLRAVVFDSNAFGHARPDVTFLEDVARRLHSIGIETWIPEPVAWEWAQHMAEDWQTVQSAMADERRRLRRAGLSPHISPYADSSAVAGAFLERLAGVAHLTVIPVSPENALAGL